MKKLLSFADIWLGRATWRDLALVKLCLFAAGVLAVDYFSRKIGFGDDNTLITKITGKSLSVGCAPPDLLL